MHAPLKLIAQIRLPDEDEDKRYFRFHLKSCDQDQLRQSLVIDEVLLIQDKTRCFALVFKKLRDGALDPLKEVALFDSLRERKQLIELTVELG